MSPVQTVLGPLPAESLGRALIHEHIFFGPSGVALDVLRTTDGGESLVDAAVKRLAGATDNGIETIVDASPIDCGRAPELLQRVAEGAGLNIISCTGLFALSPVRYFAGMPVEALAEMFVWDIQHGIGGTGVRCGAIKIATGKERISDYEEKALRAAASAQKATGAPIITHCEDGALADCQLEILLSEGANAGGVILGHVCDRPDLEYLHGLAVGGAFLGFDRMGLDVGFPDELRMASLTGLLELGLASSIAISHDLTCARLGYRPAWYDETMGKRSYAHVPGTVIPQLEAKFGAGLSDQLLVENPRRLFSFAA